MIVHADLTFQVEVPSAGRSPHPTRCTGRVRADGTDVTVEFAPMPSLGGSSTRPLVRPLAEQLEQAGLTVALVGPDGPLLRLGADVRAPWWQVLATHSSRIQVVSLRALARSLPGPRLFQVALPPSTVLPQVRDGQDTRRHRWQLAARQLVRPAVRRRR